MCRLILDQNEVEFEDLFEVESTQHLRFVTIAKVNSVRRRLVLNLTHGRTLTVNFPCDWANGCYSRGDRIYFNESLFSSTLDN